MSSSPYFLQKGLDTDEKISYFCLIRCLKDSELVEQGTHEELLAADGEYKKLYHLQAKAFIADDEPEKPVG